MRIWLAFAACACGTQPTPHVKSRSAVAVVASQPAQRPLQAQCTGRWWGTLTWKSDVWQCNNIAPIGYVLELHRRVSGFASQAQSFDVDLPFRRAAPGSEAFDIDMASAEPSADGDCAGSLIVRRGPLSGRYDVRVHDGRPSVHAELDVGSSRCIGDDDRPLFMWDQGGAAVSPWVAGARGRYSFVITWPADECPRAALPGRVDAEFEIANDGGLRAVTTSLLRNEPPSGAKITTSAHVDPVDHTRVSYEYVHSDPFWRLEIVFRGESGTAVYQRSGCDVKGTVSVEHDVSR